MIGRAAGLSVKRAAVPVPVSWAPPLQFAGHTWLGVRGAALGSSRAGAGVGAESWRRRREAPRRFPSGAVRKVSDPGARSGVGGDADDGGEGRRSARSAAKGRRSSGEHAAGRLSPQFGSPTGRTTDGTGEGGWRTFLTWPGVAPAAARGPQGMAGNISQHNGNSWLWEDRLSWSQNFPGMQAEGRAYMWQSSSCDIGLLNPLPRDLL